MSKVFDIAPGSVLQTIRSKTIGEDRTYPVGVRSATITCTACYATNKIINPESVIGGVRVICPRCKTEGVVPLAEFERS